MVMNLRPQWNCRNGIAAMELANHLSYPAVYFIVQKYAIFFKIANRF